jgi:hypothetical protein
MLSLITIIIVVVFTIVVIIIIIIIFITFSDLTYYVFDSGIIKPDTCNFSLVADIHLPFVGCNQIY